jgi:hypothetical protein
VHRDVAATVDALLRGMPLALELRTRRPDGAVARQLVLPGALPGRARAAGMAPGTFPGESGQRVLVEQGLPPAALGPGLLRRRERQRHRRAGSSGSWGGGEGSWTDRRQGRLTPGRAGRALPDGPERRSSRRGRYERSA